MEMEPIRPRSNIAKNQPPKNVVISNLSTRMAGIRVCSECLRDFRIETSSAKVYCPSCVIARGQRIEAIADRVEREEQAEVEAGRARYVNGYVCYE